MSSGEDAPEEDGAIDDDVKGFRQGWLLRLVGEGATYNLTRFAFLRLLGLVYFVAFVSLTLQIDPLIGKDGLLPVPWFLARVLAATGSHSAAFFRLPTLFWFSASDAVLHLGCYAGVILSLAVCAGVTNAVVQLALWALYLSFVHVGQIFYGYGWEMQLVETGFLAVFLCPAMTWGPFPKTAPSPVVIWLLRWLIFRVMLGAGLIKLRGDACWRDLSCLVYHYETQPVPSPLSYFLHRLPRSAHALGVLVNHGVELVVPWFVFGPRRARTVAGALIIAFQITLIVSGNLSFLNWLTIAPAIACFDDKTFGRLFPARLRERAARAVTSRAQRFASYGLAFVVMILSVNPVLNLVSPGQAMNQSFDPFDLVNTYGAFGSVGREREEVILEGTSDEDPGVDTLWLEYDLPCKPGDVRRRPCLITPYHYRLDWQMWFLPFSSAGREPWFVHLVWKLLQGDRGVMRLFASDPFPGKPPRWIRASLYRYEFTHPGDGSGAWWKRTLLREYLPPISADDPALLAYMEEMKWSR